VTKAEARAILHRSVSTATALQGPTCIYRAKGTHRQVTLSVQHVDLAAVRKIATPISQARLGKHVAYCVRYGQIMTYVPLATKRVLNVTGGCSVGLAFARRALPRL
jgi:hypothetical protein